MLSVRLCRTNGQCAYGERTISHPDLSAMLADWRRLFRNSHVSNLLFNSQKPIDDGILLTWQRMLTDIRESIDINCVLGEIQVSF